MGYSGCFFEQNTALRADQALTKGMTCPGERRKDARRTRAVSAFPLTVPLQRADNGVDHPARQEVDGGLAAELVARAALDQPRTEAALHRRHHRRARALRP